MKSQCVPSANPNCNYLNVTNFVTLDLISISDKPQTEPRHQCISEVRYKQKQIT